MGGQEADGRPPVNERAMHIDQIRERIARNDYDVDPAAVAAAIVARLESVFVARQGDGAA